MLAVNQNWCAFGVGDYPEKLNYILSLGMPCLHKDVFPIERQILDLICVRVKCSEIDNRLDSEISEIEHPKGCGLSASVQIIADLVKVGDSFESDWRRPRGRPIGLGSQEGKG